VSVCSPICAHHLVYYFIFRYCWLNSASAVASGQIAADRLSGDRTADPRAVGEALQARGIPVWLDIWKLKAGGGAGMFDEIAAGLLASEVVVVFVSSE
jgi:hypothetical protein